MCALIVALSIGLVRGDLVLTDTADVIELNHYYDEKGKLVFDQVIFWEWFGTESEFHVVAWRFAKGPGQLPWRDWSRRIYVTIWLDGEKLRRVTSPSFMETWTQYDPEVQDRRFIPQGERRGLIRRHRLRRTTDATNTVNVAREGLTPE